MTSGTARSSPSAPTDYKAEAERNDRRGFTVDEWAAALEAAEKRGRVAGLREAAGIAEKWATDPRTVRGILSLAAEVERS